MLTFPQLVHLIVFPVLVQQLVRHVKADMNWKMQLVSFLPLPVPPSTINAAMNDDSSLNPIAKNIIISDKFRSNRSNCYL